MLRHVTYNLVLRSLSSQGGVGTCTLSRLKQLRASRATHPQGKLGECKGKTIYGLRLRAAPSCTESFGVDKPSWEFEL